MFVYILVTLINCQEVDTVSIPIKVYGIHPLDVDEDYPAILNNTYFATEIELGNPVRKYNVTIDLVSGSYFFASEKIYKNHWPEIIPITEDGIKCYNSIIDVYLEFSGRFCHSDMKIGNVSLEDFDFQIADSIDGNSRIKKSSGVIGLNPKIDDLTDYDEESSDFIMSLKSIGKIYSYDFTIFFEKDLRKGKVILGANPCDYDSKYDEKKFSKVKVYLGFSRTKGWPFLFNNLTYGNTNIICPKDSRIELSINEWLITGTHEFNETIYKEFFAKQIELGICEYHNYIQGVWNRFIYSCKKNVNLNDFKEVKFYVRELNYNFTFTKNDLFFNYKDKKIFSIVFIDTYFPIWIFGSMFLYKFSPVVFNQDSKTIGFYLENLENHIPENNKTIDNLKSIIILSILIIVAIIAIIFLAFYIYQLNKRRKIRKNEIKDEFEYQQAIN